MKANFIRSKRGVAPHLSPPRFARSGAAGVAFNLLGALLVAAPAIAQDSVADFYRNKTVTFIVGLPPGGSFDLYARLVAGHVGKHIPGRPNIVVQNLPGADRKSTRLNSSHIPLSRMPSSA